MKGKLKFQKSIDKVLGFFLIVLILLIKLFSKKKTISRKPKKIVILKFDSIGDSLLLLSFIKELKSVSNAKIIVCCTSPLREIFLGRKFVDKVISLDKRSLVLNFLGVIKKLRKENAEVCIDSGQSANISGIISNLIARSSIGFKTETLRDKVYTESIKMNFKEHILFDIYNLGKPLGIQLMSLPKTIPSILTKEEKYKKIEDFIKDKKKYIILSPGTNLKYKRVDETFVTLTNYLADLNYFIFFIGAKQEKNIYLDILEKVKVNLRDKIFEFYGSLRIKDLAYLMRRSSAVIGIDGGPMHLAASVGAKTIVLFGHEDPRRYKPIGENVTSLFGLPLNKNKYMGSYYKENRLKKISWAQIKEALENINIR